LLDIKQVLQIAGKSSADSRVIAKTLLTVKAAFPIASFSQPHARAGGQPRTPQLSYVTPEVFQRKITIITAATRAAASSPVGISKPSVKSCNISCTSMSEDS
jgi:hypothetical protein